MFTVYSQAKAEPTSPKNTEAPSAPGPHAAAPPEVTTPDDVLVELDEDEEAVEFDEIDAVPFVDEIVPFEDDCPPVCNFVSETYEMCG